MSETYTKTVSVTLKRASAPAEYDASFVLSDSSVDRVGDTIDPKAYDFVAKNADKIIALFNHDAEKIAGYWTNIKRNGESLVADLKLASTNIGRMCKAALDDGVPLAASIGFRAKGKPNDEGGVHFLADGFEVFETSLVATPCHPKAQRLKSLAAEFNVDLDRPSIKAEVDAASSVSSPDLSGLDIYNAAMRTITRSQS